MKKSKWILDYTTLDEEEIKEFLQKRAFKLQVDIPSIPLKDILVNVLKVVKSVDDEFKPTNTALLFFTNEPSMIIYPKCYKNSTLQW